MNQTPLPTAAGQIFLTAQWRHLVMLNYQVQPDMLTRYVPAGLELDDYRGQHYVSLVGFEFLQTRLRGWAIPGHQHFPEVNLRMYVRRKVGQQVRRGVVFIREIVPRWAVATIARWIYNEPYRAVPMRHRVDLRSDQDINVEYAWRLAGNWCAIKAQGAGQPQPLGLDSLEEFIAEHYWGYGKLRSGRSAEYHVAHPAWHVWPQVEATLVGDTTQLYGSEFAAILREPPASAFIALGSEVAVHCANVLP